MIRVVLYLVIVGLLALGTAWLADRPGEVAITWPGWRMRGASRRASRGRYC
jgi:HemY protein